MSERVKTRESCVVHFTMMQNIENICKNYSPWPQASGPASCHLSWLFAQLHPDGAADL